MTGYQRWIVEATKCPPADAAEVEEIMRTQQPTLDGLDRVAFNRLARTSYVVFKAVRDGEL